MRQDHQLICIRILSRFQDDLENPEIMDDMAALAMCGAHALGMMRMAAALGCLTPSESKEIRQYVEYKLRKEEMRHEALNY